MSTTSITALSVKESIEFKNGSFIIGKGKFSFLNFFDTLEIHLDAFENISDDFNFDLKRNNGKYKIVRDNSAMMIWQPFILDYQIKELKSPICIFPCENNSIKLKLAGKNFLKLGLITLNIYLDNLGVRPVIYAFPKNLSHTTRFSNDNFIIWEIEYLHQGSEYSVFLSNFSNQSKIRKIEVSYHVADELITGLRIKKCHFKVDSISNSKIEINLRTEIKESITF